MRVKQDKYHNVHEYSTATQVSQTAASVCTEILIEAYGATMTSSNICLSYLGVIKPMNGTLQYRNFCLGTSGVKRQEVLHSAIASQTHCNSLLYSHNSLAISSRCHSNPTTGRRLIAYLSTNPMSNISATYSCTCSIGTGRLCRINIGQPYLHRQMMG